MGMEETEKNMISYRIIEKFLWLKTHACKNSRYITHCNWVRGATQMKKHTVKSIHHQHVQENIKSVIMFLCQFWQIHWQDQSPLNNQCHLSRVDFCSVKNSKWKKKKHLIRPKSNLLVWLAALYQPAISFGRQDKLITTPLTCYYDGISKEQVNLSECDHISLLFGAFHVRPGSHKKTSKNINKNFKESIKLHTFHRSTLTYIYSIHSKHHTT